MVLIFKADDANLLIKPVSCLTRNVALGPTKAVPAVADNNRKAAVANFIFNGYGRHLKSRFVRNLKKENHRTSIV